MPSVILQPEIEDRIRREFQLALDKLEQASDKEKADATERLNRAVRRLYDFIGYGKAHDRR